MSRHSKRDTRSPHERLRELRAGAIVVLVTVGVVLVLRKLEKADREAL